MAVGIDVMAEAFRPGERLYLPGSTGEPLALLSALAARPERSRGLRILSSAVPGINGMALDGLDRDIEVTGLFMQPGLRAAQRDGRFRQLPLSFAGFVDHVRDRVTVDTCVVQVAPPDASGRGGSSVSGSPRRRFGSVKRKSARSSSSILSASPHRRSWGVSPIAPRAATCS